MPQVRPLKEVEPTDATKAALRDAKRIKESAAGLDLRFAKFAKWLEAQPARTSARVILPDPDKDGTDLHIGFNRALGKWQLVYSWRDTGDSSPISKDHWSTLSSATLETKIHAVALLPQLLADAAQRQSQLAGRLEAANLAFDELLRPLELEGV